MPGDVRSLAPHRGGLPSTQLREVLRIIARIGHGESPGQGLKGKHTNTENVARLCGMPTGNMLRSEVTGGAGLVHPCKRRPGQMPRETRVHQRKPAAGAPSHIAWREIPMDDIQLVAGRETFGDVRDHRQDRIWFPGERADERPKIGAIQEFFDPADCFGSITDLYCLGQDPNYEVRLDGGQHRLPKRHAHQGLGLRGTTAGSPPAYLDVLTRYRSEIEAGLGPTILQVLFDSLDDHQGGRWEAAFGQHVRRLAASGEFGGRVVAVGPFWTADGHNEIDVVVLAGRARIPILVGEAKWAREVSAPRLVADLHRKAAALPGAPHDLQIAICARERVTNPPDEVISITADDIFS